MKKTIFLKNKVSSFRFFVWKACRLPSNQELIRTNNQAPIPEASSFAFFEWIVDIQKQVLASSPFLSEEQEKDQWNSISSELDQTLVEMSHCLPNLRFRVDYLALSFGSVESLVSFLIGLQPPRLASYYTLVQRGTLFPLQKLSRFSFLLVEIEGKFLLQIPNEYATLVYQKILTQDSLYTLVTDKVAQFVRLDLRCFLKSPILKVEKEFDHLRRFTLDYLEKSSQKKFVTSEKGAQINIHPPGQKNLTTVYSVFDEEDQKEEDPFFVGNGLVVQYEILDNLLEKRILSTVRINRSFQESLRLFRTLYLENYFVQSGIEDGKLCRPLTQKLKNNIQNEACLSFPSSSQIVLFREKEIDLLSLESLPILIAIFFFAEQQQNLVFSENGIVVVALKKKEILDLLGYQDSTKNYAFLDKCIRELSELKMKMIEYWVSKKGDKKLIQKRKNQNFLDTEIFSIQSQKAKPILKSLKVQVNTSLLRFLLERMPVVPPSIFQDYQTFLVNRNKSLSKNGRQPKRTNYSSSLLISFLTASRMPLVYEGPIPKDYNSFCDFLQLSEDISTEFLPGFSFPPISLEKEKKQWIFHIGDSTLTVPLSQN